jgi:chorismate-pyruvate lyase
MLAALHAVLLRHDSATEALERWCRSRLTASRARVAAEIVPCTPAEPCPDQRRRLGVGPAEVVRYRRVRLTCAGRVLSEAENWYVPGRLTAEMNRLLAATDTPFGRVVQALRFRRHLLAADMLWAPPVAGGDAGACDDPAAPPHVLRHRALLVSADGAPISEVVETYMSASLFLASPCA